MTCGIRKLLLRDQYVFLAVRLCPDFFLIHCNVFSPQFDDVPDMFVRILFIFFPYLYLNSFVIFIFQIFKYESPLEFPSIIR